MKASCEGKVVSAQHPQENRGFAGIALVQLVGDALYRRIDFRLGNHDLELFVV